LFIASINRHSINKCEKEEENAGLDEIDGRESTYIHNDQFSISLQHYTDECCDLIRPIGLNYQKQNKFLALGNNTEKKYDVLRNILSKIFHVVFKRSFYDNNENTELNIDDTFLSIIEKLGKMMKDDYESPSNVSFKTRLRHLIKEDNVIDYETANDYISTLEKAIIHYHIKKKNLKPYKIEFEDIIISCDCSLIDIVDIYNQSKIMICPECAIIFAEIEKLVDKFCCTISYKDKVQLKSFMSNKFLEMEIKEAYKPTRQDKNLVIINHKKDYCDCKCSCDCYDCN
jgi:hypothetical protein